MMTAVNRLHLATVFSDVGPAGPRFEVWRDAQGVALQYVEDRPEPRELRYPSLKAAAVAVMLLLPRGACWERSPASKAIRATRIRDALVASRSIRFSCNNGVDWRGKGNFVAVREVYVVLTQANGLWRATCMDADGPIGHVERDLLDKVVTILVEDWSPMDVCPVPGEEVDALTTTERWAKGAAAVALVQAANIRRTTPGGGQ